MESSHGVGNGKIASSRATCQWQYASGSLNRRGGSYYARLNWRF